MTAPDRRLPTTDPADLLLARPFFRTWRVRWWRAAWTEPRINQFGRHADADRFANQVMLHEPSKADGPVVRVQIEERLMSTWEVLHRHDLPVPDDDGAGGQPGSH